MNKDALTAFEAVHGERSRHKTPENTRRTHNRSGAAITIHLDEQLGLDSAAGLVLVRGAPAAADGVDLVDEDRGGGVEPSLRGNVGKKPFSDLNFQKCHFSNHGKEEQMFLGALMSHLVTD